MSKKVLVFESDAAFASELRSEFSRLGCQSTVVDDGNAGIQVAQADRPDFILLSIELPRMNGFSVCNKLKKDPALKDIPLIIMSSESSEETFDQHRKLRTRAEDYVHKPISFGELLQHVQRLVQLEGAGVETAENEEVLIIDDDVLLEDDEATGVGKAPSNPAMRRSSVPPRPASMPPEQSMDGEVEDAFGRLAINSAPPKFASAPPRAPSVRPSSAFPHFAPPEMTSETTERSSYPPPAAPSAPPRAPSARPGSMPAPASIPAAANGASSEDLQRALDAQHALEVERDRLQSELSSLSDVASERDRLAKEVRELHDKLESSLATTGKQAASSSRDFLDLRENLNKKDKEILALKESAAQKDKENLESREKMLSLERAKGELDDRVLSVERELAEARDALEAARVIEEQAKRVSDESNAKIQKAQTEADARTREVAELRLKFTETVGAHERLVTQLREEHESQRNEAVSAIKAEVDRDKTSAVEAAIAAFRVDLEREHERALSARQAELSERYASELNSQKEEHRDETRRLVEAHQREIEELKQRLEREGQGRLAEEMGKSDQRVEELEQQLKSAHAAELSVLRESLGETLRDVERERDDRLKRAQDEHDGLIASLKEAHEKALESEKSQAAQAVELAKTQHAEIVSALENDKNAKYAALEARAQRELSEAQVGAQEIRESLEGELSKAMTELTSLRDGIKEAVSQKELIEKESRGTIANLGEQLASLTQSRDTAQSELAQLRERTQLMERELDKARNDLRDREARLVVETGRATRAVEKWESDRASLERAKDALAVVLQQIEETETRTISG